MTMRRWPLYFALMATLLGVRVRPALADLGEGLVAYYPFNGNANDETGNGYDGTVHGATLSPDRFGRPMSAYDFDGVDDDIVIGQEPNFPSWATHAVSVWFLNDGGRDQGNGYGQKILSKGEFFSDFHLAVGYHRLDAVHAISHGGHLKGAGIRLWTPIQTTAIVRGITRF